MSSTSFFQFATPWAFLLLVLVVPLFIYDILKLRFIRFPVSSLQIFDSAKKTWRSYFEFLPPLMRLVAMVLLVIALARPQWGNKYVEVESEGIDIVLALDTSGSMQALDFELEGQTANRLEVIKSVVKNFIAKRPYDRIGMVVFGTEAYTQCPLTLDHTVLESYLEQIQIGIVGENTAIGDALATAVKRLHKSSAKSRIVILLTDGENTAGSIAPIKAAELAKEEGLKIYTIAAGTNGTVPVPVRTPFGMQRQLAHVTVDEARLKEIALATGGQFYQATETEGLNKIYDTIDELEKTKVSQKEFAEYHELYWGCLLAAIILLVVAWGLQRTVFLRIP